MDKIRINKYLSEQGICSRREADRLIACGRVMINGLSAGPGDRVSEADRISVDGKEIEKRSADSYELIAFNKPKGVVCTSSDRDRAVNIIEYINYGKRIFPIGRLDKDSEGLILLTDMGDLVNRVNRSSYGHEKEYIVSCERRLSEGFLKKMSEGVEIKVPGRQEGEYRFVVTDPCKVRKLSEDTFDIVLTQGLNRQIRRMCAALGNRVTELKRVRVMNIELGGLKTGEYRRITGKELECFMRLINDKEETGLKGPSFTGGNKI